MSLQDLLANPRLGLRRADALPPRPAPMTGPLALPTLAPAGTHEWFAPDDTPKMPLPLTLLGTLAAADTPCPTVAWVGRNCWPTVRLLQNIYGGMFALAARHSIFIDPRNDQERFWVMEEVLRCPGVQAVVADGRGMTPTISRRLQLAAEAGGTRGLIACPPRAAAQPSWAMTRWRVRPVVSQGLWPRWEIAASKGAPDAQQRWIVEYEVRNGKGALHIPPHLGRGSGTPQHVRHGGIA